MENYFFCTTCNHTREVGDCNHTSQEYVLPGLLKLKIANVPGDFKVAAHAADMAIDSAEKGVFKRPRHFWWQAKQEVEESVASSKHLDKLVKSRLEKIKKSKSMDSKHFDAFDDAVRSGHPSKFNHLEHLGITKLVPFVPPFSRQKPTESAEAKMKELHAYLLQREAERYGR